MPPLKNPLVKKLVSGGQTGADRAALDWAIEHRIEHGGWCPLGRLAEDGPIDPKYELTETPTPDYAQRTEWNVRDSDGTVIFSIKEKLAGGSLTTWQMASEFAKPCLHLHQESDAAPRSLQNWLRSNRIHTLNVAGPRLSEEPEITDFVKNVLDEALAP